VLAKPAAERGQGDVALQGELALAETAFGELVEDLSNLTRAAESAFRHGHDEASFGWEALCRPEIMRDRCGCLVAYVYHAPGGTGRAPIAIATETNDGQVLYQMDAASYDRWYEAPRGQWIGQRELALILEELKPRPGESLLDVGCGTGFFTRALADSLDSRITGVDINPEWVEYARLRNERRASYEAGDRWAGSSQFHPLDSISRRCAKHKSTNRLGHVPTDHHHIAWLPTRLTLLATSGLIETLYSPVRIFSTAASTVPSAPR